MAKKKGYSSFWGELLAFDLYKRNQGRLTRQVTIGVLALVVFFGAWTLSQGILSDYKDTWIKVGIPIAISAIGAWVIFRVANFPRFADFLISVEGEMDKVSWSRKAELYRATIVVISTMFFLGAVLLTYDIIWQWFFRWIGFLHEGDAPGDS